MSTDRDDTPPRGEAFLRLAARHAVTAAGETIPCQIFRRGHAAPAQDGSVADDEAEVEIMMFTPTTFPKAAYDPIERDRIESGRPASRVDVHYRHQRAVRQDAIAMSGMDRQDRARDERSTLRIVPEAIDTIRRSLSRALTSAGQRIGPEAA
jgi:hypothetical protein